MNLLIVAFIFWLPVESSCLPKPIVIYSCSNGYIGFTSNAPLEIIKAESNSLRGAVDLTARTFLFTMDVNTFAGFNSALQREHFNENYLETVRYPEASFKGKIIEDLDLSIPGTYEVRAKGILQVHGIDQERIIRCRVEVQDRLLAVNAAFSVLLEDHNIKIPRVVHQKISPEIQVLIQAELKQVK